MLMLTAYSTSSHCVRMMHFATNYVQLRRREEQHMAAREGGDVKLLGMQLSPFALRVRMALEMKGVSYEYVEEDLSCKSDLLLASNPARREVPVLIHGGKPVCESLVILQYVDEVWPGGGGGGGGDRLLPSDPRDRAAARFWPAYVDDELFPAYGRVMMSGADEEERAGKVREARAVVSRLEEAFARCSHRGGFFVGGGSLGYLDLVVGSHLFWLEALRRMFSVALIDESRTPLLAAWAERFAVAAAAMGAVPDVDKAVAHAWKLRAAAGMPAE